jgi:hypothetical protein
MFSGNNKPIGKWPKRVLAGPLASATAGAAKEIPCQQDQQERNVIRLDLDIQFPRPREQISPDLLDSANYMSAAKRKKTAINEAPNISKVHVKLVQAIFKGESGDDLIKKIEDADGLETLLHLRLRITDKALQASQHYFTIFT